MPVILTKCGCLILQVIAATCLKCGKQYYISFVKNFIPFLAVKTI